MRWKEVFIEFSGFRKRISPLTHGAVLRPVFSGPLENRSPHSSRQFDDVHTPQRVLPKLQFVHSLITGISMRTLVLPTLSTALALAFFMNASAANLTKVEYKEAKDTIATQYKAAKEACAAFKSNAKDICMEEAKGAERVALAEIETRYEPTTKHTYQFAVAKADAVYAVAKEKCDDLAGNAKDVCRKEAKSVHVASVAEAKVNEKTKINNAEATEKVKDAKTIAADSNASAQASANSDIKKADYKVAAEKCDVMVGDSKSKCISDAKVKFGQN
jgi:hypothetical protein